MHKSIINKFDVKTKNHTFSFDIKHLKQETYDLACTNNCMFIQYTLSNPLAIQTSKLILFYIISRDPA